jgi:hypothetical protein
MDEYTANAGPPQDQERSTSQPDTAAAPRSLSSQEPASQTPLEQEPVAALAEPSETIPDLLPAGEAVLTEEATVDAPGTLTVSMNLLLSRLTRRHLLVELGVAAGVIALGAGASLIVLSNNASTGTAQDASTTPGSDGNSAASGSGPLPTQGRVPGLPQQLQAWRTKHLTIQPTQRFTHQRGTLIVPLGVVDQVYPNPYDPYYVHLHGYLLGGEIVAHTQLFWYLGLEAVDGTQFVGKFRVGPVDQTPQTFGVLVTQQSNDFIEGGGTADYPSIVFSPKALAQALATLTNHCVVVTLIRQTLLSDAEGIPSKMRADINQQARIADQFAQFDVDVVRKTPFAQAPSTEVQPIHSLIDPSPIHYRSPADAVRYPLITQVVLRHSDQLFPKLSAVK